MEIREYDALAAQAAAMVQPNTALGLGPGPLAERIARRIAWTGGLAVVSASPAVALAFRYHAARGQQILQLGGVASDSGGWVGPLALASIDRITLDLLILHVHALDVRNGLYAPDPYQAEVERALIGRSHCIVAIADRRAWRRLAPMPIESSLTAPLGAIRTLITTAALAPAIQAAARAAVGDLVLVGAGRTRTFQSDHAEPAKERPA